MKRTFLVVAVLALFSTNAFAGTGLTPDLLGAGAAFDRIEGDDFDTQITQIQVQYAYSFEINNVSSVSTGHRIMAAPGNEDDPTSYVNEFSVLYAYDAGGGFNFFAGPQMSVLGTNFIGSREELYGGYAGISLPLEGEARMIVGYRYLVGPQNLSQKGLVFGPVFEI
jgi:hypothetical protein